LSERPAPPWAPAAAWGLLLSVVVALRGTLGLPGPGWPSDRPLAVWLLLLAATTLVVVPVGLWLRRALLKDPTSADRALLLGGALSTLPLALFAGVLKSTTHHRPLGGATFAVVACVVLALCIGLALRVGGAVKVPWLKQSFSACCGLSLLSTGVLAAGSAPVLADFLLLALACAGAGLTEIPRLVERIPAPVVGVAWGLLVLGSLLVSRDAGLMQSLQARAPVSFAPLSWLGDGS
jgi:hypothetical protein